MRRRLAPLVAIAALALSAGAAAASELTERWDLWFAGLRIGEARLTVANGGGGWRARGEIEAAPVFAAFVPGAAFGETTGVWEGATPVPERFAADGRFGRTRQTVSLRHVEGGPPAVEAEPPLRLRDYDPAPATLVGALDPVGAAVAALALPTGADPCGRTIPVFDTRRRYDVRLAPAVTEADGRLRCEGSYVRVSGFKAKHMALPPHPFTAWWRVADGRPVLERVMSETAWGHAVLLRRP